MVSLPASWPLRPHTQPPENLLPFHKAWALPPQDSVFGFLACSCVIEDSQPGSSDVREVGICGPCWGGRGQAERAIGSPFSLWERTAWDRKAHRVLILGGEGRLYWALISPPGGCLHPPSQSSRQPLKDGVYLASVVPACCFFFFLNLVNEAPCL